MIKQPKMKRSLRTKDARSRDSSHRNNGLALGHSALTNQSQRPRFLTSHQHEKSWTQAIQSTDLDLTKQTSEAVA